MIAAKLTGRLGNLILEIWNIFFYAEQKGIPFNSICLDKNYKATCCGHGKYNHLKYFNLDNYIENNKEFFKNIYDNFIPYSDCRNLIDNMTKYKFNDAFDNPNIQDNVFLTDIVANTSYLRKANNLNLFKKLFYNNELVEKNKQIYDDIFDRIALHIRRTDYADWRNGSCLLTADQINNVILGYIKDNNQNKFIVFSDDIEWCKVNIRKQNYDIIFHNPQEKDYNDLILMSLCKDIYRNGGHSSFSGCANLLKKCYNII